MERFSSFVPVHLVPLSSQPPTSLSRLVPFHVFFLLSLPRARMRIRPGLSSSGLLRRRVCVCVSTPVSKDFTPLFTTALVRLSFGITSSDFPSMQLVRNLGYPDFHSHRGWGLHDYTTGGEHRS